MNSSRRTVRRTTVLLAAALSVAGVLAWPDGLPARAEEANSSPAGWERSHERHPTGQLALNVHHTVHLVASAVSSGVLGIKWEWP
ncbi:hypothetical protein B0I31_12526 [Saccharothrix carnea]|uniref:Uncharacterized protein n=1 Tax=Saccharothrix carnea TaxID=1280637 RepID=A0A2P8HLM7_SACCR|nr:hypothetical protein [Saccharothrix carnea]PSL47119.1 hypothetical protein B0I31_12526 [Saccharothrix carnea]